MIKTKNTYSSDFSSKALMECRVTSRCVQLHILTQMLLRKGLGQNKTGLSEQSPVAGLRVLWSPPEDPPAASPPVQS